jgi:hypothetical protein
MLYGSHDYRNHYFHCRPTSHHALQAIQRDIQESERDTASIEPSAKESPAKPATPSSKRLLKLSEAAEFLGLSKATLYKLTMTRQIPFIKLDSRTMFSEEWLLTRLKAHEHTPAADAGTDRTKSSEFPRTCTLVCDDTEEEDMHDSAVIPLVIVLVNVGLPRARHYLVRSNFPGPLCELGGVQHLKAQKPTICLGRVDEVDRKAARLPLTEASCRPRMPMTGVAELGAKPNSIPYKRQL